MWFWLTGCGLVIILEKIRLGFLKQHSTGTDALIGENYTVHKKKFYYIIVTAMEQLKG